MFYRRTGWLRREYDEKLISELEELKSSWMNQKFLLEKSLEPSNDIVMETKMAELKYFSMFREAKYRKISIKR